MSVDRRTGLHWLTREECLEKLAADCIGRLAVAVGHAPAIFPVNYVLDGETIVFRTDEGTKLDHGVRAPVSFEIDEFDRELRTGWSVVVAGRLEEVTRYDAQALERVEGLGVDPWAGGDKVHYARLLPSRITGRRLGPRA